MTTGALGINPFLTGVKSFLDAGDFSVFYQANDKSPEVGHLVGRMSDYEKTLATLPLIERKIFIKKLPQLKSELATRGLIKDVANRASAMLGLMWSEVYTRLGDTAFQSQDGLMFFGEEIVAVPWERGLGFPAVNTPLVLPEILQKDVLALVAEISETKDFGKILEKRGEDEEVIGEITEEELLIYSAHNHLFRFFVANPGNLDDRVSFLLDRKLKALGDIFWSDIGFRLGEVAYKTGEIGLREGGQIVLYKRQTDGHNCETCSVQEYCALAK